MNSSTLPNVHFDLDEAYADLLSISDNLDDPNKLYFWFQPWPNLAAEKEILIWFNGGCLPDPVRRLPSSLLYLPEGATSYVNRTDVQKAIKTPVGTNWAICTDGGIFLNGDLSPFSSTTVLGGVIDRTQNVIIGHGELNSLLIANGTLLAIQDMTFGGKLGFQRRPVEPFYVPCHHAGSDSSLAGAGVFGRTHTESGLTFVGIDLSSHMAPQYAPSAAYRNLEILLGRVNSLSNKAPFITDVDAAQSEDKLGAGTVPPGYSE